MIEQLFDTPNNQVFNNILQRILSLQPIRGKYPPQWEKVFSDFADFIQKNDSYANNSDLIKAIYQFGQQFDSDELISIIMRCREQGIGYNHSLFSVNSAIYYERNRNYISALNEFQEGFERNVEPIGFLEVSFEKFKNRMNLRLQSNDKLELGVLEGIKYTFNGGIASKTFQTNDYAVPKYDILRILEFKPELMYDQIKSRPKITKNNNVPRNENDSMKRPEPYNKSNVLSPKLGPANGGHVSHNSQSKSNNRRDISATNSFSPIPNRFNTKKNESLDASLNMDSAPRPYKSNLLKSKPPPKAVAEHKNDSIKFKEPESVNMDEEDDDPIPYIFDQPAQSILKKPIKSESKNASRSGVSFGSFVDSPKPNVHRIPTPTTVRTLKVGDDIITPSFSAHILEKLGSRTFRVNRDVEEFIVKQITDDLPIFQPSNPELFALPIPEIQEYFVVPYISDYHFQQVMGICQQTKDKEGTCLFYTLQLVRIVRNLEEANFQCGDLLDNLLFKPSSAELGPFDDSGDWLNFGIILIGCDKLTMKSTNADRKSIAAIFQSMALGTKYNGSTPACPRNWNSEIWKLVFETLNSNDSLMQLENSISEYLKNESQKHPYRLRRLVSIINMKLLDSS